MKPVKQNVIASAVASTLPAAQASKLSDGKTRALLNLATAAHAAIAADVEAASLAGSWWEQYATAHAKGATSEEMRDACRDVCEYADEQAIADNRCRQYAHQCRILADHGVTLLDADGVLRSEVTVKAYGEEFTGTLGGVAQKLYKKAPKKARGTKARDDGDKAPKGGKIEVLPVVVGAAPALDAALVTRLAGLMQAGTSYAKDADGANILTRPMLSGDAAKFGTILAETCPEAILCMAAGIARQRLEAQAIAEAAAAKRKAGEKVDAKAAIAARAAAKPKRARKSAQVTA